MVTVHSKDLFWEHIFSVPEFSKVDTKVLATLIEVHSGNAYNVWKKSGLKHYPTVLRSLKKLRKRGFVTATRTVGMRSTRHYKLTLVGTISYHLLKKDKKTLYNILIENSPKFRDLVNYKFRDIDAIASYAISWFMNFSLSGREDLKRATLDERVESPFDDRINNDLMSINDRDSKNDLIEIAKIPWIGDLTLRILDTNINWANDLLEKWKDLKKSLTV